MVRLYVLPNGNKPVYAAQAVYRVACLELGQWDRGSGAGRLARRQPKRYYPVKLDLAKEDRDRMCAVEESSEAVLEGALGIIVWHSIRQSGHSHGDMVLRGLKGNRS